MTLYWTIFSALVVVLIYILIGKRGRLKFSKGTIRFFKCCMRLFKWSLKWGSITLACLFGLLLIFYAEEDWRGKRAWEQCKRQLAAQGEKLDWKHFIPPPVPNDQNFALTPIVAGSYESYLDTNGRSIDPTKTNVVDRLGMYEITSIPWTNYLIAFGSWQTGIKIDLKAWQTCLREALVTNGTRVTNEFPITPQPQTPAADVLLALSKYDSTIEELRRASRLPYSRFPVNTDTDNPLRDLRIPYLQSLGSCSVVLVLRSVAELENNQSEKALADVKLILYLSDSIKGVPFLVISDDRSYVLDLAAQAIWEGLIENKWSADELVSIQQELSKADLSTNYETNLRAELAMDLSFIEFERQTHDADHDNDHTPTDEVDFQERMTRLYHRLFPQGWHYQNEAILADTFQQIFQVEAQAKQTILSPEVARQNDAASEFFEMRSDLPYYYYAEKFCPALGFYSPRLAFQQTSVNFAYTACALERYRLKHGEYPETLDALVPEFTEKVPMDVINGQPLHYRRISDGKFLLYSVGWNEKDDGGRPGKTSYGRIDYSDGDWVWPTTAR